MLRTAPRYSLGAGISAKVPRLGTRVLTGYKWVSGVTVSRVDGYGESLFQMEPYLHLMVRQPLPKFALGRWGAITGCHKLLAPGYLSTRGFLASALTSPPPHAKFGHRRPAP